jgi:heavy metal translocating P-type ATPase
LASATREQEPRYCCFGCRFAASIAGERLRFSNPSGAQMRLGLAVFFAMNVMVFTMFLWSQPENVTDAAAKVLYEVARYLCLLFSIPVVLLLGPALVQDAIDGVRTGRLAASLLLLVGIGASLLYSAWSVVRGEGHVYFEVGVMVLVLVTLGRWLEAEGKLQTTRSLRELQSLLPNKVRRITPQGTGMIDLAMVDIGDEIRILAGERIAVDGRVLRGRAAVDEQMVTGESVPVEKDRGQLVYSGTFNLDGELIVAVTTAVHEGTFQRLLDAVLEAAAQRTAYQRLADRIAAWLLPVVAVLATLTFTIHVWSAPNDGLASLERPLLAALAVLVIACPCALGLATPMVLWAALGRAANEQVLFRQGDALSRLAAAKIVCFDKTGTLTTGQLEVIDRWIAPQTTRKLVNHAAAALADRSNHPAAKAIAQAVCGDASLIDLEQMYECPGRGVKAWSPALRSEVFLGSWRWMLENECGTEDWRKAAERNAWDRHALVFLAIDNRLAAVFVLDEQLRPHAAAAIVSLRKLGLSVRLLTGDRTSRAAHLADQLDIEFEAELLPQAKLRRIRELRQQFGPLVMVGDGLNDAPALAAADVGIALGCGADLSRDAAAVCLLSNRLDRIAWSIQLARDTTHALRWNLLWAFGYNLAAVPLAAAGIVNPIIAALAMAASSLLVIANSLKLSGSQVSQASSPSDDEPLAHAVNATPDSSPVHP